jgi:AbrB family looped-hinge helix DNA binding protein
MVLTISSKGWVVIPAEMRKKYNLVPGSEVTLVDYGGVLTIVPVTADPVRRGRGLLKGRPSLSDALQRDREVEKRREKRLVGE